MEKIKVSIIVPIYKVERYLDRCVQSLMNQTLHEIEVILIDDESPDNCGKMCDEYVKQDERIKVIHKKNEGLGLSRNIGINIAQGEYLAFIDSDDYIDKNAYEQMYKKSKQENADVCFCGVKFLDANQKERSKIVNPFAKDIFRSEEVIQEVLYNMLQSKPKTEKTSSYLELGGVWKAIYKKKIFEQNDILFCSERKFISEDYIFHLDYISKCNCLTFVSDVFYYHCDNDTSLTKTYKADRLEKNKVLYYELVRKTQKIGIYQDVKRGISSIFIGSVRACIKQETSNDYKLAIDNIRKVCNDRCVRKNIKVTYKRTLKQIVFDLLVFIKATKILYRICKSVEE